MTTGQPEAGRDKLTIADKDLRGSTFTRVSLEEATIRVARLVGALFDDVDARDLRLNNVNLSRARFANVSLAGATIENADLSGMAISQSNINEMTVNGMNLGDLIALWNETHGAAE